MYLWLVSMIAQNIRCQSLSDIVTMVSDNIDCLDRIVVVRMYLQSKQYATHIHVLLTNA